MKQKQRRKNNKERNKEGTKRKQTEKDKKEGIKKITRRGRPKKAKEKQRETLKNKQKLPF